MYPRTCSADDAYRGRCTQFSTHSKLAERASERVGGWVREFKWRPFTDSGAGVRSFSSSPLIAAVLLPVLNERLMQRRNNLQFQRLHRLLRAVCRCFSTPKNIIAHLLHFSPLLTALNLHVSDVFDCYTLFVPWSTCFCWTIHKTSSTGFKSALLERLAAATCPAQWRRHSYAPSCCSVYLLIGAM